MFCSQCGEANEDAAQYCTKCGAPVAPGAPGRSGSPPSRQSPSKVILIVAAAAVLLFIVIVAILTSVSMDNYGEFQIQAKVSRTKSDLRSMAVAIEAYYVDNDAYPAWSIGADSLNGDEFPSFTLYNQDYQLKTLTTPVAYLTAYFPDPFSPQDNRRSFNFYRTKFCWILWGTGPDGDYDIGLNYVENTVDWTKPQPSLESMLMAYDPTNGAISSGDIFRFKN